MAFVGKVSYSIAIALFGLVIFSEFSFSSVEGKDDCASKTNSSCEECTKLSCQWCKDNKGCYDLQWKGSQCSHSDMYKKQCFVSTKLLIIIVPCVAGGVLIILGCLIYCCCCRRCRGRRDKFEREDRKLKKERSERKQIFDQRKAERQARNEEIRMKYGLKPVASGESRYQRLGENYP